MKDFAAIISNGTISDYTYYNRYLSDAGLIICADGGAYHARKLGAMPGVLIGDFDSASADDLEYFRNAGVEIISFPAEKDMTDTELAAEFAIEKGYKELVFIGGTGSRLDHTLSNVFLLRKLLDMGANGLIVNESNEITLINDRIKFEKGDNVKVSLLPLSEKVTGVTTRGLYYPLDNAEMRMGSSWGVSNEFAADLAEISVREGLLLVIRSRD